jgi:hypothetical protein
MKELANDSNLTTPVAELVENVRTEEKIKKERDC